MSGLQPLDEDNFMPVLVGWAQDAYDDELDRHSGDYPYPANFKTMESMTTQFLTWFVLEWKNPRTGITPLEEFVDKFVEDPELAAKLGLFGLAFYSDFQIIRYVSDHVVDAVDRNTQKEYRVEFSNKPPRSYAGVSFRGYIRPWKEDGTYRATGIVVFEVLPTNTGFITADMQDELLRMFMKEKRDKTEAVPISGTSKLSAYLKNQPVELVNMVAEFLNVQEGKKRERIAAIKTALSSDGADRILKSLPKKEQDCLLYVHRSPQKAVKYGELERRFGKDDFDPFLSKRGARSVIGCLREKGLLMVGRKAIQNRRYKVVVVPAEMKGALDVLTPSEPSQDEPRPAKKRGWKPQLRS